LSTLSETACCEVSTKQRKGKRWIRYCTASNMVIRWSNPTEIGATRPTALGIAGSGSPTNYQWFLANTGSDLNSIGTSTSSARNDCRQFKISSSIHATTSSCSRAEQTPQWHREDPKMDPGNPRTHWSNRQPAGYRPSQNPRNRIVILSAPLL